MEVKFELLDFQNYLNIDEKIDENMDLAILGKGDNSELDQLLNLKEEYENNFLVFFDQLSKDPGFALKTYSELSKLHHKQGEHVTDVNNDETYITTYDVEDSHDMVEPNGEPGECWRYNIGDVVTVGDLVFVGVHPFNEDDRLEIISLEGGEFEYQYYAMLVQRGNGHAYLINDEELI